jgi:mono/diheme cytochrome c family protein
MHEMKNRWTIPLTVLAAVVGTVVVVALVTILVLASGSVSVGDDIKPDLIERTLAPWGRDRSVERHAPREKNPYAGDPNAIATGLDHYRENCLVCHGAPGVPMTDVSKGLNPPAPSLGKEENDVPDGELFWVTKHGIRFTSMPAFGYTQSDEEIWDIVAFLRHLPELTAEEREFLRERGGEEQAQHRQELPTVERIPQGRSRVAAKSAGRTPDAH